MALMTSAQRSDLDTSIQAVDTTGVTGRQPSIIIGLDGLPVISYFNDSTDDLMVFHCNDLTCSSGTRSTVDSTNNVGQYSSITIGRNGFPSSVTMMQPHATLSSPAASTSLARTPLSQPSTQQASSASGHPSSPTLVAMPLLLITDQGNGDLLALNCVNETCTNNDVWTIDGTGDVGQYSSVMRNTRGDVWISYFDETNGDLKVARCSNANCNSPVIKTVDGNPSSASGGNDEVVGLWTSITAATDGSPLIAYSKYDGTNSSGGLVANCSNSQCTEATAYQFISAGSNIMFRDFSITLGPDGIGRVIHTLGSLNRAYFIDCSNPACTAAQINDQIIIDQVEDTVITIGADGLPILAYHEYSNDELRVVHCSDLSCEPYHRRR